MTTEDISRFLFQPNKGYTSVRMQQGRILLDADWNAYESIEREIDRQTLIDLVCAKGTANNGFRIGQVSNITVEFPQRTDDDIQFPLQIQTYNFEIASGSFYLGGLRFQGEDPAKTFLSQSDWLQIDSSPDFLPERPIGLEENEVRYHLVYLRGWEQCVTAVEDRELRDTALGVDTSVRIRRMQRIEVFPLAGDQDTCATAFAALQRQLISEIHAFDDRSCELQSGARLTVTFEPNGLAEDPCQPTPNQGYLGADNQTIRVQLTTPERFIWSYDNASPLYRVQVSDIIDPAVTNGERRLITFLTLPRDQEAQPLAGQAVEIIPWGAVLPNQEKVAEFQGQFFTVVSNYDPMDNSLRLAQAVPQEWLNWLATHPQYYSDHDPSEQQQYFYLRLWTGGSGDAEQPDIPFAPGGDAVPLSGTGLRVSFSRRGITGDFWIMAARPNTPNLLSPWELLESAPPMGPKNYYAPLALIRWTAVQPPSVQDCRDRFQPLCQVQGCCNVTVGDGSTSHGLFNSLEDAIAFLPDTGGKICLLPGIHQANAVLRERRNIHITGCGSHTIVLPRRDLVNQPIFRIEASQNIYLAQMTLVAHTGTAIQVSDPDTIQSASQGIHILDNHIVACIHAIEIRVNNQRSGNNEIRIVHNQLAILDKAGGRATILVLADDVLIEDNRLVVLTAPDPDDPNPPERPDDLTGDVLDPCIDPQIFYTPRFPLAQWTTQVFLYIAQLVFLNPISYQARGGIQIGGGSEKIKIIDNTIIGGAGHGITLGYLPDFSDSDPDNSTPNQPNSDENPIPFLIDTLNQEERAILLREFDSTLYEITIEDNTIQSMGLCGIGVVAFFDTNAIPLLVSVETLFIHRNLINRCLQQPPARIPRTLILIIGIGAISLGVCDTLVIHDNQIENNGLSQINPTCGIFVLSGERVDISRNQIVRNAPMNPAINLPTQTGIRGGIVMSCLASRTFSLENTDVSEVDLDLSETLAAKIHENIVSQPLGQALLIFAIGPLSIVGNHFASQDIDIIANPYARFAGAVLIFNLGLPIQEVLGGIGISLLSTQNFTARTAITSNASVSESNGAFVANPPSRPSLRTLFWPSGNVLFNDNQTILDLREVRGRQEATVDFTFSSQYIFSGDDVSFQGNQSDCNFLFDLLITNSFVLGFSVRLVNNRLKEGFLSLLSIFSISIMNITTNNQCSHCIFSLGAPNFVIETNNQILFNNLCRNLSEILSQ